jgi:hypothetical protein
MSVLADADLRGLSVNGWFLVERRVLAEGRRALLGRERLARTLALEGQEEPRRLGRLLDHRRVARAGDEPDG